MNSPDEIIQLRDELKKIQVKARKSRTRGIIGFVLLVLVTICSVAYGFVQQVAAEKSAILAVRQRELAEASAMEAQRNLQEAARQEQMAQHQVAISQAAYEELRKCCNRKK